MWLVDIIYTLVIDVVSKVRLIRDSFIIIIIIVMISGALYYTIHYNIIEISQY